MEFKNPKTIPELYSVFEVLKPISSFYPGFSSWYFDKVVPGVVSGNDKVIVALKKGELVGVSLIKSTSSEKKLRALRIGDKFQKSGAGLYLIDESLRQLDCDLPVCSVSEEMLHDYSRIFIERYGFSLNHVHKGLYRPGKLEYAFNEDASLKEKSIYF
jgi:hypothetical protein